MAARTPRDEAKRDLVLQLLRSGSTREHAARYVGIDPSTLRRWVSGDARFRHACDEAEATLLVRAIATVSDAAFGRPAQHDDAGRVIRAEIKSNAEYAMWILERKDPLNYGRRVSFDIRATVERYAAEHGFAADEVISEIERLYAENAENYRRS